jgi:8-oxo-dGTP pyrophosphatase MutT (NUDIX family)
MDFAQLFKDENKLYEFIHQKLSSHKHQTYKYADVPYKHAAVLIPLFFKDGEAHLLFTKRTDKVETHKGQISFPGGMADETDDKLRETALRETWEEMGIKSTDIQLLGKTDKFLTNTNFMVTPYVGHFPYPYDFVISTDEIDRIIEVPLSHLIKPDIFEIKLWIKDDIKWNIHYYNYNGDIIWGVTGFLLSNFLQIAFRLNRFDQSLISK